MKNWNILNTTKKLKIADLINLLLENRGINTKKERDNFLNPLIENVTVESVGIDKKQLIKALKRINQAIKSQEEIVIFGDYDVDGITGAAILWETFHALGAKVLPHIPHRVDEGYGLSIVGIENAKIKSPNLKLIITDDNGIVAYEAIDYANNIGIDVIITDHHVPGETLPNAHSIVHTTKLCGAGVAYLLSKEINKTTIASKAKQSLEQKIAASPSVPCNDEIDNHLELAALGTIADMVPLTDGNRAIVKHGLLKIGQTKRPGLQALFNQSGLEKKTFTPYEVGYIIAPRLNAAGRIESGMDSLRLLCTTDPARAKQLAEKLELINKERQLVLKNATQHALLAVQNLESKPKSLLFVAHESYQPGVIGLVAGRLVEEFYLPSIVLSIGKTHSKASARSISGFNLIEFLRLHTDHFINVGGHPMAAGFTIETAKLTLLKDLLEKSASDLLNESILTRSLKIDCELPLKEINQNLYEQIQTLAPFGMGNPEPTFVSIDVEVKAFKLLGKDKAHLKLVIKQADSQTFEAIAFRMSEYATNLKVGDKIDIAYTIDENVWNGNTKLQLKVKDIKLQNDK